VSTVLWSLQWLHVRTKSKTHIQLAHTLASQCAAGQLAKHLLSLGEGKLPFNTLNARTKLQNTLRRLEKNGNGETAFS
jgi:hypothetical protein